MTGRLVGIGFVVLLHIGLVYALVTGLAREVVEAVVHPIQTEIVEETTPPPDEPPPPPPPPELKAPPPPAIPPPEIQIATPPPQQNAPQVVAREAPVRQEAFVPTPPAQAQVSRVAPVVNSRSCKQPEYPSQSQRLEEEGTVVLAFLVGTDGRVKDSRVENSSGSNRLDEAARKALSLCRFQPGTANGQPEESWHRMKYTWRLQDAR